MFDYTNPHNKVLIYAEGAFSTLRRKIYPLRAKVADGFIRYANAHIVGVIDSFAEEQNVFQVMGIREDIPVSPTIKDFLQKTGISPDVLVIGTAPSGGEVEEKLIEDIEFALDHGMHIVSGMHFELNKEQKLVDIAKKNNVGMWDVRIPPDAIGVASCKAYFVKKPILLTCAADAAIGKMTVGFELERELAMRGIQGELLATGQTAIMIKGKGISIDRVIGDFMPGAVEKLVLDADTRNRFLIIEGQGGLSHPGYAPVTLALLHGGMPTHAILIVRPLRRHSIGSKLIKLPSVIETIALYKTSSLPIRIPEFIGIAVNSSGMSDEEAQNAIQSYEEETGLPVEDVIRFPTKKLADAWEKVIIDYESRP